jgi:hypothetical protein
MIDRIKINEERLNKSLDSVNKLEKDLDDFKSIKKDLDLLNKYYGSKKWFEDKDAYEKGKITDINCGVLSEDSVWNLNEDVKDLLEEMESIVKFYKK